MKNKNKWILILILAILVGLGSYIYIDSVEKEKIKEEKKRQEKEIEKKREKQKKALTQNFMDDFRENFQYGMTQKEIKDKLGEPLEIMGKEETKQALVNEHENEYGSYLTKESWRDWSRGMKNKKGYHYSKKNPTSCFIYRVNSKEADFVYFYFTDGHLSKLNFA